MLETTEERAKLLKAGFIGKTIEQLYIEINNFKIVRTPAFTELVEIEFPQNKGNVTNSEIEVKLR